MNATILEIENESLRSRLDLITREVQHFWVQNSYGHFTNHGTAQSQYIQRTLAQLAQELPSDKRLTDDEIFIVSAAAWLYEIGMQSPNLPQDVVGFSYNPRVSLTFDQLQKIRANKHTLSYRLIIDSVRQDYSGPPLRLGLTRPVDNYVRAIAEVCKGCSSEPLKLVAEKMSINNMNVRIRLLTALLRLADQLYIDDSRIKIDRLRNAPLPIDEKTGWWIYHYTQTAPIDRGNILFHYLLPSAHGQYLPHIRTLIEPKFSVNNPVIFYLRDEWDLRLMVHSRPQVTLEPPPGFQQEMSPEMIAYLKMEIEVDPALQDHVPTTRKTHQDEKALLVLDYESFLLQLGREGYFLSQEELARLVITLLREAKSELSGVNIVEGIAVGHWERQDLQADARILKRAYRLVTVRDDQTVEEVLHEEFAKLLEGDDAPAQTLLITPREDLAEIVRSFTDRKLVVNAWISDLPEAYAFTALVRQPRLLTGIIRADLPAPQRLTEQELAGVQTAWILKLDEYSRTADAAEISLENLTQVLNSVEGTRGRGNWWFLYLLEQNILRITNSMQSLWQLNDDHQQVYKARAQRDAIIQALLSLTRKGTSVSLQNLEHSLVSVLAFRQGEQEIQHFLNLLQEEQIVRSERAALPDRGIVWSLNPAHWRVIAADSQRYLRLLVLTIDHFLVQGYQYIHKHLLVRKLARYVGEDAAEAIYELALHKGLIQVQIVAEKQYNRDEPLIEVRLVLEHESVQQTLLTRNILLDLLYHRSGTTGITSEELWKALPKHRGHLSKEELNLWLDVLRSESLVLFTSSASGISRACLDLAAPLTQLLLGRFNVFGLIQTMRIMGATYTPNRARPLEEIIERITKHITRGQDHLATLAVQYAKQTRLVEIVREDLAKGDWQERAYLKITTFVKNLDESEKGVRDALVSLMRDLSNRRFHDGRVPLPVLRSEMEKDSSFGLTREEVQYWLNQAEHHQTKDLRRLLRRETERVSDGTYQVYMLLDAQEGR